MSLGFEDSGRLTGSATIGEEMQALITELFPICRSITGNGTRETLRILQRYIPLEIREVASGTKVFDWTVPKEWNITDAYVKNSKGVRVIDFQESNLHVLNYSIPINKYVSLAELKQHLYTLPSHPDWIPYMTSYYRENWGFCLSHKRYMGLEEGEYEVFIDATLEDGSLSYGELCLQGETEEEILVSCHICHPSLANDNLSGVSLCTMLAKHVGTLCRRYSYRFLFVPGTIGAIVWLASNEDMVAKIKHGLVLSGLGEGGNFTYKRSRKGNCEIDQVAAHVLGRSGVRHKVVDFTPYGYDERQYCSPGFNMSVGCLSRTPYGEYAEYHTSADNLSFVRPMYLAESYFITVSILDILEKNILYFNLHSKCEPQLGRRGLYSSAGTAEIALLWVLSFSDGKHTLLDIAERSGLPFDIVHKASAMLHEHGLLRKVESVGEKIR